ncbi:MAG: VWA domain-containing protein [Myxococcales bacterium]|nr:VWA domain-containing protein [Myxococcales bacterium]
MRMRWSAVFALAGATAVGGCSAASNTSGSGGDGASSGQGASGAGTGQGGGFIGVGGSGSGGAETCAADTFEGVLVPLDIYVMLDKSSSMQDSSKWTNVTTALDTFFSDAGSAGIGVGLKFFPVAPSVPPPTTCDPNNDMCGDYGPCIPIANICTGGFAGDSCTPADYASPVLPIAELPGASGALASALMSESPNGASTPTGKAMAGARLYATQWAADHPTHLTYILFATDGEPTGCSGDAAAEAAMAAAATPSVKTFVIGVGTELTFLNAVAQAGGTGQAYLVDTANTTQQFLDALAALRGNSDCKYQIPEPTGSPDYGLVNVTLVDPNDPSNTTTIPKVSGPSTCGNNPGWYYDDEANPSYIELCPASCELVKSGQLDVKVEIGCETIVR